MRKFIRRAGISLGLLLALLLVLGGVLYAVGSAKINRIYDVESANLIISNDSLVLARGAHLTRIYGCTDCHGGNLSGQVFLDAPPFRVTASNLTPGLNGVGAIYSVADFDRAIRHGVRPDGRGLVVMPSSVYNNMSDEEAAAIISYLMSLPPVETDHPETIIRPLGRVLAATVIDPSFEVRTARARSEDAPPRGTLEYGAYLTSVTCAHCHGADLRGNPRPPDPESPPAPDLAAAGNWPIDMFMHTLRTGVTPSGRQMDPMIMPWTSTAHMDDIELQAIHAYLSTLDE